MSVLKAAAELANKFPDLIAESQRVAESFVQGMHSRRKNGQGENFWQFRQWQQGDNSYNIDWRQTAKSDNIYIRQKEWETTQSFLIYKSSNKSMDFTSARKYRTKREYAEIILLAASILIFRGGEKLGVLGSKLPLQTREDSIADIYKELAEQKRLSLLGNEIKNNSKIILIGDFFEDLLELEKFCNIAAASNSKILFLQINDKAEETLHYKGRVKFADIGNVGCVKEFSRVEAISAEYVEKFLEHRKNIREIVETRGGIFKNYSTDIEFEEVLADICRLLMLR